MFILCNTISSIYESSFILNVQKPYMNVIVHTVYKWITPHRVEIKQQLLEDVQTFNCEVHCVEQFEACPVDTSLPVESNRSSAIIYMICIWFYYSFRNRYQRTDHHSQCIVMLVHHISKHLFVKIASNLLISITFLRCFCFLL